MLLSWYSEHFNFQERREEKDGIFVNPSAKPLLDFPLIGGHSSKGLHVT